MADVTVRYSAYAQRQPHGLALWCLARDGLALWNDNHRVARLALGARVAFGAFIAGSTSVALGAIVALHAAVAGLARGAGGTRRAGRGFSALGTGSAGRTRRAGRAGNDLHDGRRRWRFALASAQGEGRGEREQYQASFHDASFGSVPLCTERLDGVGREFRMAVWRGELTCHPVCRVAQGAGGGEGKWWSACSMGSWAAAVRTFAYTAVGWGGGFVQRQTKTPPEGGVLISTTEFLVARGGIEPPTQGFSILCSTDCATRPRRRIIAERLST